MSSDARPTITRVVVGWIALCRAEELRSIILGVKYTVKVKAVEAASGTSITEAEGADRVISAYLINPARVVSASRKRPTVIG